MTKPADRRFDDTTWWDPYVERIADVPTYLRRKFRQDVTDKSTGLDQEALLKLLQGMVAEGKAKGESWRVTKAKMFAALCERQAIDVSPFDYFPAIACWQRWPVMMRVVDDRAKEIKKAHFPEAMERSARNWRMSRFGSGLDYDHSVPEWHKIIPLGFPGMKRRLMKYHKPGDPFYEGMAIAMDGILRGVERFLEQGRRNLAKTADPDGRRRLQTEVAALERLMAGPPQTAYDVLLFIWIVFFDGDYLDRMQVRSLSQIDVTLTPFYEADLAAGRTTEAEFREQFRHFLWQWGSIFNYWNQPIGIGGTKADGTSEYNDVTRIILDVADECALPTPKLLVKVAPNTPEWAYDKLLDMARRHRSLVLCGEQGMTKALKARGVSDEGCRTMIMKGCYEWAEREATNETLPGTYNVLRPACEILDSAHRGKFDAPTFEAFFAEYERRLARVLRDAREVALVYEKYLDEVNPANVFTLSSEYALRKGIDAFARGCERGNNTAYFMAGLGSAVDSMMAVKELVYEKRECTLKGLGDILAANWEGHEKLRLRMKRSKRKWGNNDPEANEMGRRIAHVAGKNLNGIPNARGGVFLNSGHSARAFVWGGAYMGASPDGRKRGEEISKNISPVMGADTEGVTALVNTVSHLDILDIPADFPLDVMLHPSSVRGRAGLELMKTIVKVYHANDGCAIHFNVFDADELRDAQAHPEKYENLQVRVCGWNIRWNDMNKVEQDKYIERAEAMMK